MALRPAVHLVLLICVCRVNLSVASPLERAGELSSEEKNNPAIHNDPDPSPSPDTMSSMINAFEGGLTIDKVINMFKTFRMGSKFFKTFIQNVPFVNKFFRQLAKKNVEIRVLTKYWLSGEFPDLREIFEVVTSHSDLEKDVRATYDSQPQLHELRKLVTHGNLTDFATLDTILQLYYGRKVDVEPSQLTARGAISLRNMVDILKFIEQIKSEDLFAPMFSSDYTSVLKYLLSLDYSPLRQIHALPQDVKGGKYTFINGGTATDPAVLTLMKNIHDKYGPMMKTRGTSTQVEEAVYDMLDQLVTIVDRGTEEVNKVFAVNN